MILESIIKEDVQMNERRLITAALPYINNVPHLGHIVGSHLPADIFARYCRSKGYEILFIGGTDENGSASEIAAESVGVDINTFCEKLHEKHKKIYEWFNISYDIFSRTTRLIHHRTTQAFFQELYKKGYISRGKIKVFYSPQERRFLADRYVKGTCPKCGYEDANADQCENCASILDPTQLINPRSAITGSSLEIREVEHLFFRLDKLSKRLEKWLKEKKNWRPQVINAALGWIREGLKPRCITRDLKHGVKVPLEGFEDKVFYVWFDAPIGYISFTKEATENWEKFWKDKNTKIYHFLGKDNIPFHTIFWPGMLMAHGGFNLPYHVEGLQYLNYEGEKFSKSKKRGVFCERLLETDINPDTLRAYLVFVMPESGDTEFKWKEFQTRINSEIIGTFSNFIYRTLSFIYNKLNARIVKPSDTEFTEADKHLIETIKEKTQKIENHLGDVQLRKAFLEILSLASYGNKYLDKCEPWVTIKKDRQRTNCILYLCANLCKTLAILIQPYLPSTAQKIWEQLNLEGKVTRSGLWNSASRIDLPNNHFIKRPYILFNKLTDKYLEEFKKKVSETKDLKELFNKKECN